MRHPNLLSKLQFSKRYDISRTSVDRLVREERLMTVIIGKRLFIDITTPSIVERALISLPGRGNYKRQEYIY